MTAITRKSCVAYVSMMTTVTIIISVITKIKISNSNNSDY